MLKKILLLLFLTQPVYPISSRCPGAQRLDSYMIKTQNYVTSKLGAGGNVIMSYTAPKGGNLTFQFQSLPSIMRENCSDIKRQHSRIYIWIYGSYIPYCKENMRFPLISNDVVKIKYCNFDRKTKFSVKIYSKIVGYVFAEETLTHKVIKPRKFIQWIKVSKISSDKQSLAVELQQITFNNSVCSNSFITLQTISQDNHEETIQVICEASNVLSLQQFTFASNIKSVNITFQNVGFQLAYQIKNITLNGRNSDVDKTLSRNHHRPNKIPSYLAYILGGIFLCIIVVIILVFRRRCSRNNRKNETINATHEYDCDDYVGLESTRSKFQFHEVPFSRGALISQSDRAPCPIPRTENFNYSQVPVENDDNQKNTPVGYATVDDVLLFAQKPKDHSLIEPPKSLSTSYDAVCDEASGSSRNANVEYASIQIQNKNKPNISSQPNLLVNNLNSSRTTTMQNTSLDLLQPQTTYYMSPRPSDPDMK